MLHSSTKSIRAIAAAIVILLHATLLFLLDRGMRARPRSIDAPATYMMLVPISSAQPRHKSALDTRVHPQSKAIVVPDVSIETTDSPINTPVPTNIDWQNEASRIAKDAAKQSAAKGFRRFGPQEDPCDKSDPLNEFKPQCQKAEPDLDWNPNTPRFGFGKKPPPNGHLFDHLKPLYLKKPVEEICSKTMANCNHSSSSSTQ